MLRTRNLSVNRAAAGLCCVAASQVNLPPKGTQLLMVPVTSVPGKAPVLRPAPGSTGQRMVLQPVRTASGVQYYRRPDGQLFQLVPISQLRPVNLNQSIQSGESFLLHYIHIEFMKSDVYKRTVKSASRAGFTGLM